MTRPGRYRHYKGKEYVVLGVARHSETEEEMVVYRQDYGDRSWWCRPQEMFESMVEVASSEAGSDKRVSLPRFAYLGPTREK